MKNADQLELWMVYKDYLKFCDLTVTENYFKVS